MGLSHVASSADARLCRRVLSRYVLERGYEVNRNEWTSRDYKFLLISEHISGQYNIGRSICFGSWLG